MEISRRDLMAGAAATTASFALPSWVFGAYSADKIKIGIVGCGGRGTGAVYDALNASPDTELWAAGDVFADRLSGSVADLTKNFKDRINTKGREFSGFDAYQKVIDSGVDLVMFATPPGFRPMHIAAAVKAGKHIFAEKPVATDMAGIKMVLEAAELSKAKGLKMVAGTQRRHDIAYREAMKRVHDGAIGDITSLYAYWNQGGLWMNPRQPSWSDMEWQLRNWLYFTWLSGDHITEQHVHNLDVCNWAMQAHPISAVGVGGRQSRTDPAYGHIFDHFAIEFEYPGGAKMLSMCRQQDGTASRVSEDIIGTKGRTNANTRITGEKAWRFDGDRPNPYVEEHKHLHDAIRKNLPLNELKQVTESTMTAILGRMAAYTGQQISWDDAMKSTESLIPSKLEFGKLAVAPVPVPGRQS